MSTLQLNELIFQEKDLDEQIESVSVQIQKDLKGFCSKIKAQNKPIKERENQIKNVLKVGLLDKKNIHNGSK